MKYIKHFLLLSITLLILSCDNTEVKNTDANESIEVHADHEKIIVSKTQFEESAMKLGALTEHPFPNVIKTTGMIDVPPQNKAIVSTFVGGYIKNTPLLIGDSVKKGQALVTIENPDFVQMQQDYLEVSEQLKFLKSEYDRQKALIAEKITSQKNYLKAESEYKKALATYNGLRKKLTMLNINPNSVETGNITSIITLYAPISGSITNVNVSRGIYVSPADEIMEIINVDHIHLELNVFEKDLMQVKAGQEIVFRIPEASDDIFNADVHLVGASIDDKNRTVRVHGHLHDDKIYNFAVGMFVDAEIITDRALIKALPEESINSIDEKFYVLVQSDDETNGYIFNKREVFVGKTYKGFTAIKNSDQFKDSDKFLTKGSFNLIGEGSGGHDH